MSALFDKGREKYLGTSGGIHLDWLNDDVRVVLGRTSGYTVNLATHEFLSDVPGGSRVSTAALTSKTITAGVGDADDLIFATVAAGAACDFLVAYKEPAVSPTDATRALIWYIDGFTVTPNGNNITAVWSNGSNKIFKL